MDLEQTIEKTIANPYVGPRTFKTEEAHLFFGRERETRDLLSLIVSERLVLFYAQSGTGKSSLLNTRLIPGLAIEGFEVLPVGRISGQSGLALQADNIFVYNLLQSLHQDRALLPDLKTMTLSSFLDNLVQSDGKFRYDKLYQYTGNQELKPRVLMIDQFEEILTTNIPFWEHRAGFFEQLGQALKIDTQLWVVLAMREDFVTRLDPYLHYLPGNLRHRFYIRRLDCETALKAITLPAEKGGRSFTAGAAKILVDNLRQIRLQEHEDDTYLGEFVEPMQLQTVCFQMWVRLKDRPSGQITEQDVRELADVDKALANFYEDALHKTLTEIDLSENTLRRWFEDKLITDAGTRAIIYRGSETTGGMPNAVIDLLTEQFLLRSESRSNSIWIELIHDRFVDPILKSNRAAFQKEDGPDVRLQSARVLFQQDIERWQQFNIPIPDQTLELIDFYWEYMNLQPFEQTIILRSAIQRGWNVEQWIKRLGKEKGSMELLLALLNASEETTRCNAAQGWRYMPADFSGDELLAKVAINDTISTIRDEAVVSLARRAPQQGVELILNIETSYSRRLTALAHIWDETSPLHQLPLILRLYVILALSRIRLKRAGRAFLYHSATGMMGGIIIGLPLALLIAPLEWSFLRRDQSFISILASWLMLAPWLTSVVGTLMILSSILPLALLKKPQRSLTLLNSSLLACIIISIVMGLFQIWGSLPGSRLWQACLSGFVIGSLLGSGVAELFYRRWVNGRMPSLSVGISLGAIGGLVSAIITVPILQQYESSFLISWLVSLTIGSMFIVGEVNLAIQGADNFIEGLSPQESKGYWFK